MPQPLQDSGQDTTTESLLGPSIGKCLQGEPRADGIRRLAAQSPPLTALE